MPRKQELREFPLILEEQQPEDKGEKNRISSFCSFVCSGSSEHSTQLTKFCNYEARSVAQQVKLAPAPHMSWFEPWLLHFSSSSLLTCLSKHQKMAKHSGPATQAGDQDGIPGSWLQPDTATAAILESIGRQKIDLSLSLAILLCNVKNNCNWRKSSYKVFHYHFFV